MNRKKRNLLLCLLFALAGLLAVPVRAEENTDPVYEGMHYALDSASGEITITGYTDAVGRALEIPSSIGGKKVTAIADKAFAGSRITSVKLNEGMVSIGAGAFDNCGFLEQVNMADSVATIGTGAFYSCPELLNITMSSGLAVIDCRAFEGCSSLCSIRIPDGVKEIGYDAFKDCKRLERVTIENGVEEIGHCVFSGCGSLGEIVIPDSVTAIGAHAFENCEKLATVHMPDSVAVIGTDRNTWAGKHLVFSDPNDENKREYEGSAFYGCSALKEIVLPKNLERICPDTFRDCIGLEHIEIPGNVKTVDEYAFQGCSGLLELTIADGVNTIDVNAFKGCTSLTEAVIPDSVTAIGSRRKVTYPLVQGSVDMDMGGIFEGCTALASVRLSKNMENIYPNTFTGCISLRHVEIPKGITTIGTEAFKDCRSLEEIAIPDSVTLIDTYAFSGCIRLADLDIPDSVTAIGSAKTVPETIPGGITSTILVKKDQGGAFSGCTGLASIRLPQGLEKIYPGTFENCSTLNHVILPPKVTAVNDGAFSGCTGLTSIYIPPSITSLDMDSSGLGQSVRHIYGEKGSYAETLATGSSCEFKEKIYCSFDANGGNVGEKQRLVFPGGIYGELPVPVKDKDSFLGWYTEAGGGVKITADTKVTAQNSHTLYAHWEKAGSSGGNAGGGNENPSGGNGNSGSGNKNPGDENENPGSGNGKPGGGTDNTTGSGTSGNNSGNNQNPEKPRQTITASSKTVVYKSKPFSLKAKASGGGKLTYKSSNKKVATVSSSGKVTVKGYGKATITVKAAAKGNYLAAEKKITVKVVPKTPALKKISSPGKKGISASWSKDKTVDGYQMYICLRKDFKKGAYERTYKKTAGSMKLTGLKSRKTYYIKLRSYKKVGKKKFYSGWSKVKKVKVR